MSDETITVTLTPEVQREVEASLASGDYASKDDIVRDALTRWTRERADHRATIESIKARLAASLADPSPPIPIEKVEAELAAQRAAWLAKAG